MTRIVCLVLYDAQALDAKMQMLMAPCATLRSWALRTEKPRPSRTMMLAGGNREHASDRARSQRPRRSLVPKAASPVQRDAKTKHIHQPSPPSRSLTSNETHLTRG